MVNTTDLCTPYQYHLLSSCQYLLRPYELQFISKTMDRVESLHQQIISRYSYNIEMPIESKDGYWVYEGHHNDLTIPVTIKVIRRPEPETLKYLKRLKECKVQNVIKIYQIYENQEGSFMATEKVTFSHLKNALGKCNKLDDFDAIFLSKIILGVHVELLRAGIDWFGTQQDIQFTDNGLRLSWNNSIPFETECPFPAILSRLAGKLQMTQQKILPFPKSKVLQQLISVSGRNASQIGLSNYMKKKQKLSKKRGKNWICLKQYKNDLQYYQQIVYFAIHKDIGFARIKCFSAGKLDQDVVTLGKTKTTFTRIIQTYDQNNKTYIISEYSNDGSLYNYVNKLKANQIALKEDQIQFFFYSLFQPLKLIQDSPIKSLSMLHIKNIYIQNGIPKIGEPVPMTRQLKDQLRDKSDVPDFYHPMFKKNPSQKASTFDTYSLGVLLYKLMYTQYPIFPQGKVHIPTTPAYNKRLKATLQVLLNVGGLLKDLQKKIQVSEEVAKQVRVNKGKLLKEKKDGMKRRKREGRVILDEEFEDQDIEKEKKQDVVTQGHQPGDQQQEDQYDCCRLCCAQLQDPTKHRSFMLDSLQQSPYASYRLCTKTFCILILYIFLFYFFFIQNVFSMLSNNSSLSRHNVTISTVNYQITASNTNNFYKVFNVTDRSVISLINTGCFVNRYNSNPDYSETALGSGYQIYTVFGLIALIVVLIMKVIQIGKFDLIKTLYNMANLKSNFNLSNYLIFNFLFCAFLNNHYIFFNQIFNTIIETCLGVTLGYNFGSTDYFFSDSAQFGYVFVTLFVLHFVVLLLMLIMIVRTDKIRYTRIFNPILLLLPLIIVYFVIVRIGVIQTYFYPSLIKNINVYGQFFTTGSYINILGIIPQILFFFEFLIELIVDYIFWLSIDKRRRMLINDLSTANIIV